MNYHKTIPIKTMKQVPFLLGKNRLLFRYLHFFRWSIRRSFFRGIIDSSTASINLLLFFLIDLFFNLQRVNCNLCGWHGCNFYANVGPGYFEYSVCPNCGSTDRYRSLAAILELMTFFFSPAKNVVEVSPITAFQSYCLWQKGNRSYFSFDLNIFAMEKSNITLMHYDDESFDYFLCLHVLEHVPDDSTAVHEIFRVLKPGGYAVLQVPIDFTICNTIEYGKPNIFECGHVRRYSENCFINMLESEGFLLTKISAIDLFSEDDIIRHGFDRAHIYFAMKPEL